MKKFIFKLGVFFSILGFAILCLYSSIILFYRNTDGLALKAKPQTLFLGHSHAECAFNDSIIPNSKNLSLSAESYFYVYLKLKALLDKNNISTLFLEISNWQISASMDSTIWKDYYLSRSCKSYQAYMGRQEISFLLKKNSKKLLTSQPVVVKQQLTGMIASSSEFYDVMKWGGYLSIPRSVTDSILDSFKKPGAIKRQISRKLSGINLEYFDKILNLCQEKNIKVFLVRTPMHAESPELINEPEFKALIRERYKEHPFLDFRSFPIHNNEFADLEHLNAKGSKKFSEFFSDAMLRNQLDSLSMVSRLAFNR